MFHWICPECGREIMPAMKGCPVCDGSQAEASGLVEQAPQAVAPPPLPAVELRAAEVKSEPVPDRLLAVAEQLRSLQSQKAEAKAQEPPVVTKPESPDSEPLAIVTPEPVAADAAVTVRDLAALVSINDPSVSPAPVERDASVPASVETIDHELVPVAAGAAPADESRAPEMKLLIPESVALAVEPEAELAVEIAKVEAPIAPEPEAVKLQPEPAFKEPKRIAPALENPKMAALSAKPAVLPAQEGAADLATPTRSMHALNSALQCATPTFAVAPAEENRASILRRMKPAVAAQEARVVQAMPQLTLPGPSLPPQLNSVTEGLTFRAAASTTSVPPHAPKKATPVMAQAAPIAAVQPPRGKVRGWMVSLSVMAVLLTAGGAAIYWALPPQMLAKVKSGKPETITTRTVEITASWPRALTPSNTLSRQIEVTGIRFVAPPNGKPEIHYLVVNHSPVALKDVTVYVTLRMGSAKPGEAPLSRFSFRVPNVAPFDSKEMISTIEKVARELTFPEWQDLKAEISIGK